MNRTTTAVLFVLVLVLGGLVWWQTGREERGDFDFVERLCDGVDFTRVDKIHVDNVERGVQFSLERDARRQWSLTDPIAYPARRSLMEPLLRFLDTNEAILVPEEDLAAVQLGLDPPRIVVDVIETMPEERKKSTRIELGAHDVDGSFLYARVRGKVFRTLRNLDTTLNQHVTGFRDQHVFRVAPTDVVRVSRRGNYEEVQDGDSAFLQAHRQQFRWWLDQPVRGQADPAFFQLLLTNITALRVDEFVDDAPRALADYGLQVPRLEVELETRQGLTQKLGIGISRGGSTFAKREDLPYVWKLRPQDVARLMIPARDLLDHAMVRVLRPEVTRIDIENGSERLVLEREFDPRTEERGSREEGWTLWSEPFDVEPGSARPDGPAVHANRQKVEEILSNLEHVEIIEILGADRVPDPVDDGERLGVWLQLRDDRQGGRIGRVYRTEGGASARVFLREGESEVCLIPTEVADLVTESTRLSLQSLALFETDEVYLRRLILRRGEVSRSYFRSTEGSWRFKDLDATASELFPVLDALFFLRATEHLGVESFEALSDPVQVEIADYDGIWTTVKVGTTSHGTVAEIDGRQSVLKDQELHARLLTIFED